MNDAKVRIALFRGVNVGKTKVKMAELRELLHGNGFPNAKTYIQSGNVLFHSHSEPKVDAQRLSDLIREHWGYEVPTLVVEADYLERVVAKNPFASDPAKDPKRFYYSLLFEELTPEQETILASFDYPPEETSLGERVIYFYSPTGYGEAKMSNNFLEKKLKTTATTRNLNTLNKLIGLAREM